MAAGGHVSEVFGGLQQVTVDVEEDRATVLVPGEDSDSDSDLEKALSVQRFTAFISDSGPHGEPMGRHYTDKDYDSHRQSQLHVHHPLSSHLPLRLRRKPHGASRTHRKRRRRKKTSLPPSQVTPTIQEVDEEEAESDQQQATPTETSLTEPEFSFGSQEDLEEPTGLNPIHTEEGRHPLSAAEKKTRHRDGRLSLEDTEGQGSRPADCLPSTSSGSGLSLRRKPLHHRAALAQRSNYDLRERTRIGSMTHTEAAVYTRVPTDEQEASMLASADLDDMKMGGTQAEGKASLIWQRGDLPSFSVSV